MQPDAWDQFAAILDRLAILRVIDLDPGLVATIHPERLRRLSQEGARLTAQHLATLKPVRRRAILVATAIETQVTVTDDAVLMFERLFGQLFHRAERREEAALKRDRRTINTKIRLLARLGEAVMTARAEGAAPLSAVESVIGWDALATEVDGLLHHGADLAIERHHTDGGGVSDPVFALCHLLGFRFAPRIPNIAARRLHLFADMRPGLDIAPLAAQPSASVMLERLGCYPRANGLALREIGRVERTLFTLDWIERPEERRQATRELNKGEAQNALKRAIFFHRTGRIRDHGLQAQGHRASALNLVASAIVLWNTTYLEAAMRHLHRQGRPVLPDLFQHLSPLKWQHINLTGNYLWPNPAPRDDELRPLRQNVRLPA